jgi:DNA-binding MarR family transcriptional regulator
VTPNHTETPNIPRNVNDRPYPDHAALVERVMLAYERMMQLLVLEDAPDFGDVGITMAQAKVLHVLAGGPTHMTDLVARLRVTPSTTSGLVDKLVDQGLAARADDPADRRQVIVSVTPAGLELMERFRELNSRQLRVLLGTIAEPDLETVERAMQVLHDATARRRAEAGRPPVTVHAATVATDQGSPQ